MTTPQHIVQSVGIAYIIWDNFYFVCLAGILGGMPDIGRLFQKDSNDWNKFYTWAHKKWYCFLIPFWNVHIAEDYFMHDADGKWKWWVVYLEAILWTFEIIFYYTFLDIKLIF